MNDKDEITLCTLEAGSEQHQHEPVINPDLSPCQKQQLRSLLEKFEVVFSDRPGRTIAAEHKIRTSDHPQLHQRPYRVPVAWQDEVRREVQSMLDLDVIEPSDSPWASPIIPVRKKDGFLRICVDYRKLNAVTQDDIYQMPRVEERLGEASFITTIVTKGTTKFLLQPRIGTKQCLQLPLASIGLKPCPLGSKELRLHSRG